MTITAPMFSDLNLSDPDEQMKVTNNGGKPLRWEGLRPRVYVLQPKETSFIPFHIIVKYLGDPRSDFRKTESYKTPDGKMGVIPERRGELFRLSVLYGLYHGRVRELPKSAPKVTVTTLNDIQLDFPIFNPEGTVYKYDTMDNSMIDARTEFERMRAQMAQMEQRQNALLEKMGEDDHDGGEAPEDALPGV